MSLILWMVVCFCGVVVHHPAYFKREYARPVEAETHLTLKWTGLWWLSEMTQDKFGWRLRRLKYKINISPDNIDHRPDQFTEKRKVFWSWLFILFRIFFFFLLSSLPRYMCMKRMVLVPCPDMSKRALKIHGREVQDVSHLFTLSPPPDMASLQILQLLWREQKIPVVWPGTNLFLPRVCNSKRSGQLRHLLAEKAFGSSSASSSPSDFKACQLK